MPSSFLFTPQEAEAAFYDALERCDLEAMMALWSEEEEVVCIHPGSSRLVGSGAVREAWRQIFAQSRRLQVRISGQVLTQGLLLAVSHVTEQLVAGGKTYAPVTATNVYHRGSQGWRMISHHASPLPAPPEAREEIPALLH